MSYTFPPELDHLVQQKMAGGQYESEDALLVDAIHALDDLRAQHKQLSGEILSRLEKAGQGQSKPLDRAAFKAEALRHLAEEG